MHDFDPEWVILKVFNALGSLPFLRDLYLRPRFAPDRSLKLRRLPHVENLTFILSSRLGAIIPIARLFAGSQSMLKTLIIADRHHQNDKNAPNLIDFLLETSKNSAFLNITHLSLKGLFVKLDATVLPHLRSLISLLLKVSSYLRIKFREFLVLGFRPEMFGRFCG